MGENENEVHNEVRDDDFCFICGRKNMDGLRLSFEIDNTKREVRTVFYPSRKYQGWTQRLHGGIISSILDEVMVNAAYFSDVPAVTGEMTVRFRAPANTDARLTFTGRITDVRARFLKAEGECRTDDGKCVADAHGLLIRTTLK